MSKLLSRNLFVDTEVYKRNGFNLESQSLKALNELCSDHQLNLFITDIVLKECESNIIKSIQQALNGVKTFKRQAAILSNIESDQIKPLFSTIDEGEVFRVANTKFKDFLKSCNVTEVTTDNVSPNSVFDLYFEKLAPFGTGKKKSEFPDAFSLKAIEDLAASACEQFYIVTGDGDAKGIDSDHLIYLETLNEFLELYNQTEEALTELFHVNINKNTDWLEETIKDTVESLGAYSDDGSAAEVNEFYIENVSIEDIYVIRIDHESSQISVDTKVTYFAELQEPSFDTAMYDKEDDKYYFIDPDHIYSDTATDSVTINLAVSFNQLSDTELEITDIHDAEIEGSKWGYRVSISRHDECY